MNNKPDHVKRQAEKICSDIGDIDILIARMKSDIYFISRNYRGPLFEIEKQRCRTRINFLNCRRRTLVARYKKLTRA